MNFRIGFGYDVHKLKEGIDFTIGGIVVPFEKGPVAHSDGDVLIHAICDAILGAANLRDIGYHFPDNSEEFRGADSKELLKKVIALISDKGYMLGNIDATICLEKPKLKGHIPMMQSVLAKVMSVPLDCVSIKATTTEKMGFVGRLEGVSANAVALIYKN